MLKAATVCTLIPKMSPVTCLVAPLLLLIATTSVPGQAKAADVSRIIGGEFAGPGQFPHQVSLQLKGRHHCGGSLISDTMIVTAAHCTKDQNPSQMKAVVGTNDLSAGNGQVLGISQFIIHPQYNPQSQDFDMSLIRLSIPVPIGGAVKTIQLAEADSNYAADTMATISGFGAINQNLQLPNRLKYAQVQLWSRDYCNSQNIPGLTDRMVCAGHPSGQVSSCQGDSGGPLTVEGKLFGVVSWGFGCGAKGRPAMYTYVGALRSWIKQNANV
ncbi:trypsin 3A1 [Drosophila pseudoobscura]|uniref:Trypsin 3A1 n=1 Tax=Drosophila pseudoobscura pseudoobscura TaxID=46245 RepID=A0A6I8V4Z4_DROPS|nr:trypsin 3A1 [Drosophila pseudoobscura]